jgi:hypothetical protein
LEIEPNMTRTDRRASVPNSGRKRNLLEIATRGNEDSRLVACYALLKGKQVQTFRESVLSSPSVSYSSNRVSTHQCVRVDDVLLRFVER